MRHSLCLRSCVNERLMFYLSQDWMYRGAVGWGGGCNGVGITYINFFRPSNIPKDANWKMLESRSAASISAGMIIN